MIESSCFFNRLNSNNHIRILLGTKLKVKAYMKVDEMPLHYHQINPTSFH